MYGRPETDNWDRGDLLMAALRRLSGGRTKPARSRPTLRRELRACLLLYSRWEGLPRGGLRGGYPAGGRCRTRISTLFAVCLTSFLPPGILAHMRRAPTATSWPFPLCQQSLTVANWAASNLGGVYGQSAGEGMISGCLRRCPLSAGRKLSGIVRRALDFCLRRGKLVDAARRRSGRGRTPALVLDGEVRAAGRVLSKTPSRACFFAGPR